MIFYRSFLYDYFSLTSSCHSYNISWGTNCTCWCKFGTLETIWILACNTPTCSCYLISISALGTGWSKFRTLTTAWISARYTSPCHSQLITRKTLSTSWSKFWTSCTARITSNAFASNCSLIASITLLAFWGKIRARVAVWINTGLKLIDCESDKNNFFNHHFIVI